MRWTIVAIALTLATAVPAGVAVAAGPQIVVDADTGEVIASVGADVSWHPASLTKLMTAHLALKAIEEGRLTLYSPVTMSSNAAAQPPSKLGLPAGTRLTMIEALSAMLVKSANDVAAAVAETVGGSRQRFVAMMNREAKSMGMTGTRFVDANGLDDDMQVTTARDLAVLSVAIIKAHPEALQLFGLKSANIQGKAIRNTNGLLGKDGVDGMKTGYVCASGFNMIATSVRGGRRLVAVVLGEASTKGREAAAGRLLDLGYSLPETGVRLSGFARSNPKPATDLKRFACGRKWKGLGKPVQPGARQPAPEYGKKERKRF